MHDNRGRHGVHARHSAYQQVADRVRTNGKNHRYVNSLVARDATLARGWVDDGIACSFARYNQFPPLACGARQQNDTRSSKIPDRPI
jgi:hypothetical protein